MSFGERVWDTFATVIQMKDKIAALTETVKTQQSKIEDLTGRMIRLETAFALLHQPRTSEQPPRLPHKG